MKKLPKKAAAVAVLFAATLNLNGCVYGPPPDDLGDPTGGAMGEYREEFDPEVNVNQNVYGPPPDMSGADEDNNTNGEGNNE